jgi:hypothetical protein
MVVLWWWFMVVVMVANARPLEGGFARFKGKS